MKYFFFILVFTGTVTMTFCQIPDEFPEGSVSYITSQNIYIKFKTTKDIKVGDTLFFNNGNELVPALIVNNLSSISAVCTPISSIQFNVADKISARPKLKPSPVIQEQIPEKPAITAPATEKPELKVQTAEKPSVKPAGNNKPSKIKNKSLPGRKMQGNQKQEFHQDINGRVSVSSYSNFSNTLGGSSQRMRYTFSLNAKNIANTRLSAESYISFVHRSDKWSEIQDNIHNGLKIYNLSVNYEFNRYLKLTAGRKINPRLSNMGAIDGLQLEARFKSLTMGLLAGSRPDYTDYSYNSDLFQYGAYIGHDLVTRKGSMQTTVAYAEQMNAGNPDRRFAYLQHSNSLVKNMNFFGTLEFDLYKYDTIREKLENTFNLSNIYLSLRYRVIRQLSFSASYSSRLNIIYYETYKSYLDQIIENESLQGISLQVTGNPVRFLSIGLKGGYRYRKSDPSPSRNLYGYVTYSRIPKLNVSVTLSVTLLETSYISGKIYGASLSRDLIKGKINACLGYKYVDYGYVNIDSGAPQNIAEASLNWNIYKKLALSVSYEGTFEKSNTYSRIYLNLTQRF
jgi:hypothetical protein